MAGFLKGRHQGLSLVFNILCIILGGIYLIWSIVQIVFYNRWMNDFISFEYHKVLFAYFHTTSYIIIATNVLALLLNSQLRQRPRSNKIIIITSLFFTLLILSTSITALYFMFDLKPRITQQCSTFTSQINTYNRARNTFCYTCRCYLYAQSQDRFPNMTNSDDSATSKVQDCPGWVSSDVDDKMAKVQSDLGCSGWCQQEEIFYFVPNDYWYYSNETGWHHRRKIVTKSCFSEIKSTIQNAFYRLPIALAVIVAVCYIFHMSLTFQLIRIAAKGQ